MGHNPLLSESSSLPQLSSLISVGEVATLCGCSVRHIRRLADAGKMPPSLRLGALQRWRRADIVRWIADGCRPVRSPAAKAVR